jgi:hypothetical protein
VSEIRNIIEDFANALAEQCVDRVQVVLPSDAYWSLADEVAKRYKFDVGESVELHFTCCTVTVRREP